MEDYINAIHELTQRLIHLNKAYQSSFLGKEIHSRLNQHSQRHIRPLQLGPILKEKFNTFLAELSDIFNQYYSLQHEISRRFIETSDLQMLNNAALQSRPPKLYPEAHSIEQTIRLTHQNRQRRNKQNYNTRSNHQNNYPLEFKVLLSIVTGGVAALYFTYGSIKKIRPWLDYKKQKKQERENFQNELDAFENLKLTNPIVLLHQSLYQFYRYFYQSDVRTLYPFYHRRRTLEKKKKLALAVEKPTSDSSPKPSAPLLDEILESDNRDHLYLPENESTSDIEMDEASSSSPQEMKTANSGQSTGSAFFKAPHQRPEAENKLMDDSTALYP